ncbi:MAG TPA: PDZ domain-containing protein [Anaerolineae bacterium]
MIVAIDGQPVKQFDDVVTYLVRHTEINQKVELTVLRGGKEETVKVTLTGRPVPEAAQSQTEGNTIGDIWLGIQGLTVTPELASFCLETMFKPQMSQAVVFDDAA